MATKHSPDSITEAVYRRIRADLLSCRLLPGAKLGISKLQGELGISLGAVREALARLTSEGFVVAEPQKGFRAAPISIDDLRDLTDARVEIESLCIRRSIDHGGVEWESGIVAAAHRLSLQAIQEAAYPIRYDDDWSTAHDLFHSSLVAACDNRTLLSIRGQLYAKSARYRWLSLSMASEARQPQREHQALGAAAIGRDSDKAVALLTTHIKETARILEAAVGAEIPETRAAQNSQSRECQARGTP